MKKIYVIAFMLISSILAGCGGKTIAPVNTVIGVDELYGNYNVDFDYPTFDGNSVEARFFDIEVYSLDECKDIKKGDVLIYNNGKDRLEIKSAEKTELSIEGTGLTDEAIVLNDEYKLTEGTNFCSLSLLKKRTAYYKATGETKKLKFSDDFVFYPGFSKDDAIYDVEEAFDYLMSHPELDHSSTDAAIDGDTILAIRYLSL